MGRRRWLPRWIGVPCGPSVNAVAALLLCLINQVKEFNGCCVDSLDQQLINMQTEQGQSWGLEGCLFRTINQVNQARVNTQELLTD
jgi:hypothetical protein